MTDDINIIQKLFRNVKFRNNNILRKRNDDSIASRRFYMIGINRHHLSTFCEIYYMELMMILILILPNNNIQNL